MRSLFLSMLGTTAAVVISASAPVEAANINTSGTACQNYNAAEVVDIDYLAYGVRNLNSSLFRYVICAVARSPLLAGATSGNFYVDATLAGNTKMTCTLFSHNFEGDQLDSKPVVMDNSSNPNLKDFDVPVTLALDMYAYTSLLCPLPANRSNVLLGVTSVQ
jgi:hypothetical protein